MILYLLSHLDCPTPKALNISRRCSRCSPRQAEHLQPHLRLMVALRHYCRQLIIPLASRLFQRYRSHAAANSATGFGDPTCIGAQAPISRLQALFLCLSSCVMAAVRGSPSGLPGSYAPVRQPAYSCHPSFGDDLWQFRFRIGAPQMNALIPSKIRALAHRRMALSALRANSSLSVRLKRYNAHMAIVRALEAQGGAQ